MRIEICIAKEKMTKMPNGAVDALKEELPLLPCCDLLPSTDVPHW